MTLLGGLFHKRNTTQRQGQQTPTESVASSTSNTDSNDGDYVLPSPPIYTLPTSAASSSKLKLPFRRKQAVTRTLPGDTAPPTVSLNDAPSQPRISSVTSDSGHGLPPPPRKSSLFGIYNDSNRSLPNDTSSHVHSDTPARMSCSDLPPSPPGRPHKKSPGLFPWTRERAKSKPPPPTSTVSSLTTTSPSAEDSSFNLMSFRHVRADSPATTPEKSPPPSSNLLLPPARPRPRGNSVASDSSQRMSIAAFREAQARSRANSPVSFRPPSTADTLRVDGNGRKRASTVSVVSGTDHAQLNKDVHAPVLPSSPRAESSANTSSDSESSDDDEEVDSDGVPLPKPAQKRTATQRADGNRARSDAGYSPITASSDQASHAPRDPPKPSQLVPQSNQAPFTRTRASVSTSALTPSGAARRASILAAANSSSSSSHVQSKPPPRKLKEDLHESSDSSDTDTEDLPLSGLVVPRRPGSSASNHSSSRPRVPAKPLIDINSLTGGPPLLKPILRHRDSVKNMKRQEQKVEKDQPFSIPAALALPSSTSPPINPSLSNQNVAPINKPASATHHRRSSSDAPVITRPEGPDNDDDLMNAIRLVGALDREQYQPSGTIRPTDRIVPTPIRAREPLTSFTVLSRPPQRQSTAETSISLSPVSQTQSVTTSPAVSPQFDPGTRPRALAMTKTAVENDKSDALSVTSAARSTSSRSSSRIPPIPLIHSIPDSPSVKEDYKSDRPRSASASRTSAVNTSEGRSQPPPVPALPQASNKMLSHGFKPSLMPQRPFANNRSTRGDSPAGSSTGDSSSGRAPFTPRDGSDIGVRSKSDASDMDSTLKAREHAKKPSVTFEEPQSIRGRERAKTDLTSEERTRERRRSEAKAAIELGKIVNGRGPLVHDDSDEDARPDGRAPKINVTMENGARGVMPGWAPWQQSMGTGVTPMVPPQFNNDPAYIAAHQRALLIAKQAYQMAVAQQAMHMAGEEWERSSNIGFGSGGSVYGGGGGASVYSGGGGGSVYGGGSGGSVYGGAGMAPMGMMGMPSMGMLMPPNQWGRSSVVFPGATNSVYGGISSSQSDFGGGRGGNWATRSMYGDPFGPSSSRTSFADNGGSSNATSTHGSNSRPRARTGVSPPSSSSKTPAKSSAVRTRAAPPSSWKSGR